jgi:hypothetical protein
MNIIKTYTTVCAEYGHATALRVLSILTIHLTLKVKESDVEVGNFQKRIEKKARKFLWEELYEDVTEALKIEQALFTYDLRFELDGLGGCSRTTLKEIVNNENNIKQNP